MTHPHPSDSQWRLSDFSALQAEQVSFAGVDGVSLHGRFFRGQSPATIVLTHGYGGSQDEMLPVVDMLVAGGFSVLSYDTRSSVSSGGKATLGHLETEDLLAAVDYVSARPDTDPERIGALGVSAGGAMTVLAAARDPRIKALVSDSGWSDVLHWIGPGALRSFHGVKPLARLALWLLEIRSGGKFAELRPASVIGRISPRPVLLIHGEADAVVPMTDGIEGLAAAGTGCELWVLPGAGHGDTVAVGDREYVERVCAFFVHSLCSR